MAKSMQLDLADELKEKYEGKLAAVFAEYEAQIEPQIALLK